MLNFRLLFAPTNCLEIVYHTKVKLFNPIVRGEEVKIQKKYNTLDTGIRNVHLIVKFSIGLNDVSFPVIIHTHRIYKVWDRRVKETWCKVGSKTLEPLQSVRVRGKRWDRLFESGVPKFCFEV